MSAHTADSQFSFKLPSLSYVDAKWEEPDLLAPTAAPPRKTGLAGWLSARIAAFQAWRQDREAAAELAAMSNHELMDIGLSRSDLSRVSTLRSMKTCGCAAPAADTEDLRTTRGAVAMRPCSPWSVSIHKTPPISRMKA